MQAHRDDWRRLDLDAGDPLASFEQFFYELDSIGTFLDEATALAHLPDRLQRLCQELRRVDHLRTLCQQLDGKARQMAKPVLALEQPPPLEQFDAVAAWLRRFDGAWTDYCELYQQAHDDWRRDLQRHAIWRWQPPPLAASRHLDLQSTLASIEQLQSKASEQLCQTLSGLDFQPLCRCGFDGARAPLTDALERFDQLRQDLDSQLAFFFAQSRVRKRLADWQSQGGKLDQTTRRYLAHDAVLPGIDDISRLDAFLGGLDLCRPARVEDLAALLTERVWQPKALLAALETRITALAQGSLLKFEAKPAADADEWLQWSAETALRHAEPLPPGIGERIDAQLAAALDLRLVSLNALERLDALRLGSALEDRLIQGLLNGELSLPEATATASVAAAIRVLAMDPMPAEPEQRQHAALALYRHQHRLRPHAPDRVRTSLKQLATAPLVALPALADCIAENQDAQWLIVDCLGAPLLEAVSGVIEQRLCAWRITDRQYALAPAKSDTSAFYQSLLDRGLSHRLHKIDCVDELVHACRDPFPELEQRVATELDLALKRLNKRLDPTLPLLLFADHGFRMNDDGRYTHGGASSLERLAPVWYLAPRQ